MTEYAIVPNVRRITRITRPPVDALSGGTRSMRSFGMTTASLRTGRDVDCARQ